MIIMTIVGNRPQLVKCALLSKEIRKQHTEILVHTGQHYDGNMSSVFFEELDIPTPDVNLDVHAERPGIQLGAMIAKLEEVILNKRPDMIVVFGDTNSTLAGAIAANKTGTPLCHVEAGCRNFDRKMPEEVNRVIVDYLSDVHCCPTMHCLSNLFDEGIYNTYLTGDIMVDMLSVYATGLEYSAPCNAILTVHRQENNNEGSLRNIMKAMGQLDMDVIFPIHPRTRKTMCTYGILAPSNVHIIDPIGYVEMLNLLFTVKCVITDSGGLQKEAYMLDVPCVTLRESTEWPETLEGNRNVLVGNDVEEIVNAVRRAKPMQSVDSPFGVGKATEKIMEAIEDYYGTDGSVN